MRLRTPLWPLAEPPNFCDKAVGLCSIESCKTIKEDGAREVFRRAIETGCPEMFMAASFVVICMVRRIRRGKEPEGPTCLV